VNGVVVGSSSLLSWISKYGPLRNTLYLNVLKARIHRPSILVLASDKCIPTMACTHTFHPLDLAGHASCS